MTFLLVDHVAGYRLVAVLITGRNTEFYLPLKKHLTFFLCENMCAHVCVYIYMRMCMCICVCMFHVCVHVGVCVWGGEL